MKCEIQVFGIVQGVGFRPFIFRIAQKHDLKGTVFNSGNEGVKITVEGEKKDILNFIEMIKHENPEISRIDEIKIKWIESTEDEFSKFEILKSKKASGDWIVLPPDISICIDCLNDFNDQKNKRFYKYPFIACSVCGPRFTTATSMPYDRPNTTMSEFPFCQDCQREYQDPSDRRYHAQTFACDACGPHFSLHEKNGKQIESNNPFKDINKLIAEDNIVAIMGIGGVHLVANPNDDCILELRKRKQKRKNKPFAIMSPSIEKVRKFAIVSLEEEKLLSTFRRPIVLLEKSNEYEFSKYLAPDLSTVGVFLPYSGIHHLLFEDKSINALIMTSGNISNIPMAIEKEDVIRQLKELTDYFLLHDRKIHQRCDDSVVFLNNGKVNLIRRSRGYVPEHYNTPFPIKDLNVIAVGPELHSTGAILKKSRIYPTQHIGNVVNVETLTFLNDAIHHFMKLASMKKPDIIGCDANPIFNSSKLAREMLNRSNSLLIETQHHHAHACKLMLEHSVSEQEDIICIVLDGVGYGLDKKAWGGEILLANYADFQRLGHLEYQSMPSGDRCTYHPVRMLISILSKCKPLDEIETLIEKDYIQGLPHGKIELKTILNQLKNPNEHPLSSSMGRVLDSISALLKVCFERTYEGESAIKLEHFVKSGDGDLIFEMIRKDERHVTQIMTSSLVEHALDLLQQGKNRKDVGASFIKNLSEFIASIAIEKAHEKGIKKVGLSGGVAYNIFITKIIKTQVEKNGLIFLQHEKTPPGDAGISIGQAISAAVKYSFY
ncbi:MAG: carbamoyltransferase HypF [Candidatus Helarchaeota archaeon]